MSGLVDAKERDLIARALDRTIVVEAAAGTGKTTELVNRIVAVLAGGLARVESLVAVTFTEKAAGELKLRMREGLERARRDAPAASDEKRHLEDSLARLEEARVGTIHGFCADLLRERSVEAVVDPEFQTMTDPESLRLYSEGFDLWLQETLADPPEGVRRSLRRSSKMAWLNPDEGPVERLRQAGWTLTQWRDFGTAWRRDEFDREERIDELVDLLFQFADLTDQCAQKHKDGLYWDTEAARRLALEIRRAEDGGDGGNGRDYDGIEAGLADLLGTWRFKNPRSGYGRTYGKGLSRESVQKAHGLFLEALKLLVDAADADMAVLLQHELRESIQRYERLKQRTGRLDFLDLLIRARNLVRDSEPVRAEFQKRFTHIFVDEFQDTDPLQAEILLLLAGKEPSVSDWREIDPVPGKLFLVGDPKQSIYRFRRADVGIYLQVKELLARRGALNLKLTTSFRSVPNLQNVINASFVKFIKSDPAALQADYVPLSPFREDTDQPTVVALPVPEPFGYYGRPTKGAVEESLPEAVGGFVEWLLEESGWTVTDRQSPRERVPVSPRHVCLLFRRFDNVFAGDITRPYVEALESRGIRHLLVGGRSFHDREEVDSVRTALSAVEWPDDELSVFATLKGSLFAVGDEELLEYRHLYKRLHPFRLPGGGVPERLGPIVEALSFLATLHRERNERPIAETVNRLLDATRAHAGFVLRPSGEQALANVLHLADLARDYETTGGISFRGFVERLLEDSQARKSAEAPILEEGSEGVRIMTVHKAKGLEFPVVILADMTANLAWANAGRYIDNDRRLCAVRIAGWSPTELLERQGEELACDIAEGVRIAYVAATRARDLLVIPGLGDGPWPRDPEKGLSADASWVAPLYPAAYPPRAQWSFPGPAPGCPEFGDHTVLNRPGDEPIGGSVRPGRYELPGGSVVWWDPSKLRLKVPPAYGVRHEDLLSKEVDDGVVEADAQRYVAWRAGLEESLARASEPSVRVQTATERAAEEVERGPDGKGGGGAEVPVEIVEIAREPDRPSGKRFGSLVHAVLATVPLDAGDEDVGRAAALQARILHATDEEREAARQAVAAVLRHPLLERARAAAECRRETPLTFRADDGTLVDGAVDLAFLEDDTWTVVDFKTDRELGEEALPVYRRQVGFYASVIARATGKTASAVLLRV